MASLVASTNPLRNLADRFQAKLIDYREARALQVKYNTTFRELNALSDHDLADIGIHRSDISDIAQKHVYG